MRKKRYNYTPEEKVIILKRHLVERIPVSDLCDECRLQPKVFYAWQKQFFESGVKAFSKRDSAADCKEKKRIQQLEEKLRRGQPPVIARIHDDALILDMRTVPEQDIEPLVGAFVQALAV